MKPEVPIALPPVSPTGRPWIHPRYVPPLLALSTILTIVAAEMALPGPWTPARAVMLGAFILNNLISGASPGGRR